MKFALMELFTVAWWALLLAMIVLGVYRRRDLAFECAALLFAMALAYAMELFFWFVVPFALLTVATGFARRFSEKPVLRMVLGRVLPALLLVVAVALGARELANTNAVWPAFIMLGAALAMLLLVRRNKPWAGLGLFVAAAFVCVPVERDIRHYEEVQKMLQQLKEQEP
ncbi:MAG: hypothetical protein FWF96_05365 [Kiritimatiellaeota bacterium]|nr:hypothetical protein [Kiritimatiellota bacterium]